MVNSKCSIWGLESLLGPLREAECPCILPFLYSPSPLCKYGAAPKEYPFEVVPNHDSAVGFHTKIIVSVDLGLWNYSD